MKTIFERIGFAPFIGTGFTLLIVGLIYWSFVVTRPEHPISESATNNPGIAVDLLFEKEGVKVYRFYDRGRAIYYTDARGKTEWSVYQDKAGYQRFSVETADK